MANSLEELQSQRARLLEKVSKTGDMRQGSISEQYRCCGKQTCSCNNSDHPGHGPYYAFTKSVEGKTKTLQMRHGPLLSKMQREVQAYREFRGICHELISINEKICDLRPIQEQPGDSTESAFKKKSYKRSRRKLRGK